MENDGQYMVTKLINVEIPAQFLIANSSYIISQDYPELYIYCLNPDNNDYELINIEIDFKMKHIEMHHIYKNIFLTVSAENTIIWEIKENKECKQKIKIKSHNESFEEAFFCKNEEKSFVTLSDDNTIKLWNLEKSYYIMKITNDEKINKIEYYKNYIYYQESKKFIVIYDTNKLCERNRITIDIDNFFTIYDNKNKTYDFVIYNKTSNSLMLYSEQDNKLTLNNKVDNIFYDNNMKLIYLFFPNSLSIIEIKSMNIIYTFSKKEISKKVFFIDNDINNKYICANFLYVFFPLKIYSFSSKKLYNPNKIKCMLLSKKEFFDNCNSIISSLDLLKWENNKEIEEKELFKKNYLSSKEIVDKIISNFSFSLKEKQINASKGFAEFIKGKDSNETYIKYINLLILDNTNKNLIIDYLKFLKDNENIITFNFIEKYKKEIENYKVLFTQEELEKNKLEKKELSEKQDFINLLDDIINLDTTNKDDINKFNDDIINNFKNLQIFNQPINFNNIELYWYRNKKLLYISIKNIFEGEKIFKSFKLMKHAINEIKNRNLFEKEYILNNKILLTTLIILIVLPQDKSYTDFNLNLIETLSPDYNINNEINNKLEYIKNNFYLYKNVVIEIDKKKEKNFCISNCILKAIDKDFKLEEEELNNYNNLEKYFQNIFNIEKINKLLSKIFSSKVFKEAFQILYPDYFSYPFNNEKEALQYINDNFHYIPFKSMRSKAVTERFTSEVYFFMQNRDIDFQSNLDKKIKELIKIIFYNGCAIKSNSHEMNHSFYNILFMNSNGLNPVDTPRKNNIEFNESGKNLEILLFERCLRRMTLAECMYILNEDNYNKNLEDFRKDFTKINKNIKNLKIKEDGIFKEFNIIFNCEDYDIILKNSLINSDDIYDEDKDKNIFNSIYVDDMDMENDVLGCIRNIKSMCN